MLSGAYNHPSTTSATSSDLTTILSTTDSKETAVNTSFSSSSAASSFSALQAQNSSLSFLPLSPSSSSFSLMIESNDIWSKVEESFQSVFQSWNETVNHNPLNPSIPIHYRVIFQKILHLKDQLIQICSQKVSTALSPSPWSTLKQTLENFNFMKLAAVTESEPRKDSSLFHPSPASSSSSSCATIPEQKEETSAQEKSLQNQLDHFVKHLTLVSWIDDPQIAHYQELFTCFWKKTHDLLDTYQSQIDKVITTDRRWESILSIAQKMNLIIPDIVEQRCWQRIQEAIEAPQLEAAPLALEISYQVSPRVPSVHYSRAITEGKKYLQTESCDHRDGTIKWLQCASQEQKEEYRIWCFLGLIQLNGNLIDDGIKSFQKATQLNPHNAFAQSCLGTAYLNLHWQNPFIHQKALTQAIECLQKAMQLAPNNPSVQVHLSATYISLYRQNPSIYQKVLLNAVECLQNAIQLEPSNSFIQGHLGAAYRDLYLQNPSKNEATLKKAIDYLQKAIQLKPNNSFAQGYLGAAYRDLYLQNSSLDKSVIKQAIARLQKAIQQNPNNAFAQSYLGASYLNLYWQSPSIEHKALTQAIECLQKTIQLEPDNPVTQSWLGVAYRNFYLQNPSTNQLALIQAITCLQKAVRLDPNNVFSQGYLGITYRDQYLQNPATNINSLIQTVECIQKVTQLTPTDVIIKCMFDVSSQDLHSGNPSTNGDDLKQTIDFLQKAVQLNPNNAFIQSFLGTTYRELYLQDPFTNRTALTQGITCLQKAIQLDPNNAFAQRYLSKAEADMRQLVESSRIPNPPAASSSFSMPTSTHSTSSSSSSSFSVPTSTHSSSSSHLSPKASTLRQASNPDLKKEASEGYQATVSTSSSSKTWDPMLSPPSQTETLFPTFRTLTAPCFLSPSTLASLSSTSSWISAATSSYLRNSSSTSQPTFETSASSGSNLSLNTPSLLPSLNVLPNSCSEMASVGAALSSSPAASSFSSLQAQNFSSCSLLSLSSSSAFAPSSNQSSSSTRIEPSDIWSKVEESFQSFFQSWKEAVNHNPLNPSIPTHYRAIFQRVLRLKDQLIQTCSQKASTALSPSVWSTLKRSLESFDFMKLAVATESEQKSDFNSSPLSPASSSSSFAATLERKEEVLPQEKLLQSQFDHIVSHLTSLSETGQPLMTHYQELFNRFWQKTHDLIDVYRGQIDKILDTDRRWKSILNIAQNMNLIISNIAEQRYWQRMQDAMDSRQLEVAQLALEIAYQVGPKIQSLHYFHAVADVTRYLQTGSRVHRDLMVERLQLASQEQKGEYRIWGLLGLIQWNNNLIEDAIKSLQNAAQLTSHTAFVQSYLGTAYLNFYWQNPSSHQKALTQAIECFQKALQLDPNHTLIQVRLGATYLILYRQNTSLDQKAAIQAIECFQKALQLDPRNVLAHEYLGATYLNLSRQNPVHHQRAPIQAIECFQNALQLNPNNSFILGQIGSSYLNLYLLNTSRHQEALTQAIECLQNAIQLDLTNTFAQDYLVKAKTEQRQMIESFIASSPSAASSSAASSSAASSSEPASIHSSSSSLSASTPSSTPSSSTPFFSTPSFSFFYSHPTRLSASTQSTLAQTETSFPPFNPLLSTPFLSPSTLASLPSASLISTSTSSYLQSSSTSTPQSISEIIVPFHSDLSLNTASFFSSGDNSDVLSSSSSTLTQWSGPAQEKDSASHSKELNLLEEAAPANKKSSEECEHAKPSLEEEEKRRLLKKPKISLDSETASSLQKKSNAT